jgi:pectinesterase
MKKYLDTIVLVVALLFSCIVSKANEIVWKVSANGKGDFKTIQEAIDHIPLAQHEFIRIQIEAGVYKEKLYIKKSGFELVGSGMDKTIITQSIARDEWRCDHIDDWGVATVNVDSCSTINFKNLTIENSYGFENLEAVKIACASDSTKVKWIQRNGHQMAFRSFNATKLKFVNCHFKAFGGDTMSPWNTTDGMFYLKDCVLEGGVDFYCPRGWAYAENCSFLSNSGVAAIWHDGSLHEDAKSVLVNCTFNGFDGFNLGRFHRDAQMYLIKCRFAANMSDTLIFQVKTTNVLSWPGRVYYYDCVKANSKINVFKNNLHEAKGNPQASNINSNWVFGNRWNPIVQ